MSACNCAWNTISSRAQAKLAWFERTKRVVEMRAALAPAEGPDAPVPRPREERP